MIHSRRSFFPALLLCTGALVAQTPTVRVALCGAAGASTACQWLNVQSILQTSNAFATVDIIDVTAAGGGTPTLNQLLGYDALLCWTNTTPADNVAWGNVLADYVDAGGGVVVAVFANSSTTTGRNIDGRWQNGYEVVLDRTGSGSGSGHTLGTVHVPTHPAMAGVTAFQGGTTGSRPNGTALEVGSTLIAEWSNGKVLVAQGSRPNRIDLGFYPPPASCSQSGWVTGGDLLMVNSLLAVANAAAYQPYGSGCATSAGVPTFTAQAGFPKPAVGGVLIADLGVLPVGVALMSLGFSNQFSGPTPLPFDLTPFGAPGCSLVADPAVTQVAIGFPTATWALAIPNDNNFIGVTFFQQGVVLDPAANAGGFAVTSGMTIKVGI